MYYNNLLILLICLVKFCDPLADKNVYWTLKELRPNTPDQSVAIVAAQLGATSMFRDFAPGAMSTAASIVTLMTTVNLISEMFSYNDTNNFCKFLNLIFYQTVLIRLQLVLSKVKTNVDLTIQINFIILYFNVFQYI